MTSPNPEPVGVDNNNSDTAAPTDTNKDAQSEKILAEQDDNDTGKKKHMVKTPWTVSVMQGDDDDHKGFGYPTLTPEPIELGPTQFKKAQAAARAAGFVLREDS